MSAVCQGFVQNTWKKDFCSNCFKSKDEHSNEKVSHKNSYFATPFQSKSNFLSKNQKTTNGTGILKMTSPKKKHKRAVSFPQEVCQVIGYGGDVWSDDEEFQMSEETGEDDYIPDCDEEKQLKILTKSNTDFNTVKANLLGSTNGDAKKSYTSLLLGRMQTDSEGKKKTLLVSVTPFGHENPTVKSSIAKLSEKKQSPILPMLHKNKDSKSSDYKTNIILTSFVKNCESSLNNNINNTMRKDSESNNVVASEKTLLEEISETLEKNRIGSNINETPTESSDAKKNGHIYNNNVSMKSEERTIEITKTYEKSTDIYEFKKNTLVRNIPIKKDSEKPKVNVQTKPEFTFCKIDIEPVKHSNNELDNEIVTNNYAADTITKSMASDEDSVSTKSDSDNDDRRFVETRNPLNKPDDSLKIQVFSDGKDSDSDDKTSSDISLEDVRKVDGQSDSLQDTYENHYQPQILDLPPIIPNMDRSVFSAEASRESAGEPDGRADPEETSEPPALPRSPPPSVDPRPSFLHGMFKESSICRPTVPEKPKLPIKPLSVIKQISKRPQANVFPQQQQLIMQLQQTLNGNIAKNCLAETPATKGEATLLENTKPLMMPEINGGVIYDDCDVDISKLPLEKQDSDCSANLTPNKRKAPKPPPVEENSGSIYQRNPSANLKSDSPVVREKEKRERASSCSPKFRQGVNSNPAGDQIQVVEKVPEAAPRRSLSLSHDNLIGMDDKKKGKLKFSLRKLLRLGSSKDLDKKDLQVAIDSEGALRKEESGEMTPRPKPRLVIIHPLELNGSSVEVLTSATEVKTISKPVTNDNISLSEGSTYSGSSGGDVEEPTFKDAQTKPPPPPRSNRSSASVTEEGRSVVDGNLSKPARPPPPKSALLLRQQKQPTWSTPPSRPADNVYANLGEVRSAIAPRKPERTASMREREAQLELPKKRMPSSEDSDCDLDADPVPAPPPTNPPPPDNHNYDDVYGSEKYETPNESYENVHKRNGSDSDYEFVSNCSSTPQGNNNLIPRKMYPASSAVSRLPVKMSVPSHRKSDCNIDKSAEYLKFNNGFVRSTSLQYCGSETESEIYSPYSFYSCSEINENDSSTDFNDSINNTTNKLRVRKGRSVVHKNLEDNYGAVVIANHEALAQVLEQVQQSAIMQPSLRGLKTCTNLRWSDFTVTSSPLKAGTGNSVRVGRRVFHSAVWNSSSSGGAVNVTLMLHKEQMASQLVSQHMGQPPALCLNAVTEFCDLIPLEQFGEEGNQLVQATVVVLARSQIDTIQTFGEYLQEKISRSPANTLQKNGNPVNDKEFETLSQEKQHEATFMMLQLINGLKCLQARGVEELPAALSSFVVCRDSQAAPGKQTSMCNLSESGTDDGPPSIQTPKANSYGRLCVVQGLSEENSCNTQTDEVCSLCECAASALKVLLPRDKLTPLIRDLLHKEKSVSLSQVKSILEFTLWGPWDVVVGLPVKERELSLQRWLDLERATVLHGLVRSRVHLTVFEQSHLMFLVRSSSKIMCDSSLLLESSNIIY